MIVRVKSYLDYSRVGQEPLIEKTTFVCFYRSHMCAYIHIMTHWKKAAVLNFYEKKKSRVKIPVVLNRCKCILPKGARTAPMITRKYVVHLHTNYM